MKYIVITSKHHDGFAMFHSKASAVQHLRRHAVPARSAGRAGRGLPQARHQARLLLLAGPGLAPSRRRGRARRPLGQGPGRQHGRLHRQDRRAAGPRALDQLRRSAPCSGGTRPSDMNRERAAKLHAAAQAPAADHHQQPPLGGPGFPRRHRNARAEHSRHRLPGPRLGNLHDDERHLGLQELRPQLEDRRRRCSAT